MSEFARRTALRAHLIRRRKDVHRVMDAERIGAVIFLCAGAPNGDGWLRYLTDGRLWSGRGTIMAIRAGDSRAFIILRSTYDAEWLRETAIEVDVESTMLEKTSSPISAAARLIRTADTTLSAVGVVNVELLTAPEYAALVSALFPAAIVDVTTRMNAVRKVKGPLEIEAIRNTGRILGDGLERFAAAARPGRGALAVAGEVDGLLRAQGCFWGRVTYAFNGQPHPMSAPADRRFAEDDIVLVSLTYQGPDGYWASVAEVFAFRALPDAMADRLAASKAALDSAERAAAQGAAVEDVTAAAARGFSANRFTVSDWIIPVVHSIGTDEMESAPFGGEALEAGMVLSLRVAARLGPESAFPVAATVLVSEHGGIALTPRSNAVRRLQL
jgi:Xaa-Pro aminopeptidase